MVQPSLNGAVCGIVWWVLEASCKRLNVLIYRYTCWVVKCVTMVTMLPWVFPLLPVQLQDRRQSASANFTAVQDRSCEGERRQTNNASCLWLFRLSNQAGVSRQMQLMANCVLIRGIYTAISTFKSSTMLVNGDMKCK